MKFHMLNPLQVIKDHRGVQRSSNSSNLTPESLATGFWFASRLKLNGKRRVRRGSFSRELSGHPGSASAGRKRQHPALVTSSSAASPPPASPGLLRSLHRANPLAELLLPLAELADLLAELLVPLAELADLLAELLVPLADLLAELLEAPIVVIHQEGAPTDKSS